MFFKNKNNKGVITTRVTQTGESARFEEMVREKAREQNRKCPECGHINKPKLLGFRYEDGSGSGYFGNCEKCKAKWQTVY